MKNIFSIIFIFSLVCFFSCKNTNSSESTQQTELNSENNMDSEEVINEKAPTILYAWVDKLRIREQPTTKSEIVAEVKEGTSFTYLEEKTDYKEKINLRGTLYNEPWLKIKTDEGKEGWVYGGAVKFYEPVVDASPSPYEKCFEYRKDGNWKKFAACRERVSAQQLKKDARFVFQNKEGIELTLLNGKKIKLENELRDTSENYLERKYSHYLPQVGFFVMQNTYFEGGDYSLVNDKSGKEVFIGGFPKVSPDGKYILTTNADGNAGFEFNGVEVYGFPQGKFTQLLEHEWDNVEPHAGIWLDNQTIQVSLIPTEINKDEKPKNIQIKRNEQGEWEMGN